MMYVLFYGVWLFVFAAVVAHSVQAGKRRAKIDAYASIASTLRIERVNPSREEPAFSGIIGDIAIDIRRIKARDQGVFPFDMTLRASSARIDPSITLVNEPEQRVRSGAIPGKDFHFGDHDFDRLVRVSGAPEALCAGLDSRARAAFITLAGLHQFRCDMSAVSIERDLPPSEIADAVRKIAAAARAIVDARSDPRATLLDNVQTCSDMMTVARCLRILLRDHKNADETAAATRACRARVDLPEKDEAECSSRVLLFHPDPTVKRDALARLGTIGTPQTATFIKKQKDGALRDMHVDMVAALVEINSRYPDLATMAGQISLSEDSADGALSIAQQQPAARKQSS